MHRLAWEYMRDRIYAGRNYVAPFEKTAKTREGIRRMVERGALWKPDKRATTRRSMTYCAPLGCRSTWRPIGINYSRTRPHRLGRTESGSGMGKRSAMLQLVGRLATALADAARESQQLAAVEDEERRMTGDWHTAEFMWPELLPPSAMQGSKLADWQRAAAAGGLLETWIPDGDGGR